MTADDFAAPAPSPERVNTPVKAPAPQARADRRAWASAADAPRDALPGRRGQSMAVALAAALLLLAQGALLAPARAQNTQPLSIVRITPSGDDVPGGRQIVLQFDRTMVPLGNMARKAHEVPIRIQPRLDCRWRWLDQATLACDLASGQAFARATRYRLAIDPGLVATDGARLPRTIEHSFVTARPQVRWITVHGWLGPQRPVLRVTFNQAVTRDSARAHLFFRATAAPAGREAVRVGAVHDDGLAALAASASPAQLAHAALLGSTPQRRWLISPRAALPADSEYSLYVEAGLLGDGPQAGVEQRALLTLATFPAFAFRGVRCTDVNSQSHVDLAVNKIQQGPGVCDPLSGIALLFSAPVHGADLQSALQLQPPLDARRGANGVDGQGPADRATRFAHRRGHLYPAWLGERLQAHQGYRARTAPAAIKDVFARPLHQPIDMFFGTAHRRPRLHISHPSAVLESAVDSDVPVYVTNLDALHLSYQTSNDAGLDGASTRGPTLRTHRIAVPHAPDIAFAVPLQTRTLLAGDSGAVHGTIRPEPVTGDDRRERYFFAQVTPFSVTVKLGHFSSVAWVTRLDDGMPVSGATVSIYHGRYDRFAGSAAVAGGAGEANLPAPAVRQFLTNQHGIAELPGAAELDPQLQLSRSWRHDEPRLFVRVDKAGQLALLPLDNEFRLWTRDVWPSAKTAFGHLRAWGTTAQGIYRSGDTIQYKLYVRHQDTHTLTAAPARGYQLSVMDPKNEPVLDKLAVTLNEFGAFDGELSLPQNAAVGWYRFRLHSEHGQHTLEAFRVLVGDFTPSPFKVRTLLNGNAFRAGDELRVDTLANLHAGGPYTHAQARVTVRVAARALRPAHPLASRFRYDTLTADATAHGWQIVHQDQHELDSRGERDARLTLADYGVLYGRLQVESAVQDDRGKRVTALASAPFTARDRFVGLRSPEWLHTQGEATRIEYLVIDAAGEPVDNVPVALTISREEIFTARVKGAGNTYESRYERRWVDVATCTGRAALTASDCYFTPQHAGRYRIAATIADSRGRAQHSELTTWVQGPSRVVWQHSDDGALNIVAERERYQVGDTARYLLRNPYPGAHALVTIERYGVLRSWTQQLLGSTPVIAFKILPDDLPGFHLSVTVMSPRVQAPPPQRGQIDLGKPALRMGYVRVPVDDPYKRLHIEVTPQRAVYKPREQARIDFKVRARKPGDNTDGALRAPVELAVAVLDEAVFDLIGAGSANFDPYRGFYELENLDVLSYALLTRLVGRQKFETKGANSGGDGGGQVLGLRDLFKFVSYWNPSVPVNTDGQASVTVPLPDNLTGWRVLALAVTSTDRLGLGEGNFKVNKDTELRPVMPNQVSAGDRFSAAFTVLNRSATPRTLAVKLSASGDALATQSEITRTLTVAPFARERLAIPIATVRAGEVRLRAQAGDESDTDLLQHRLSVHDTQVLNTAASYGDISAGERAVGIDFAVPAQALPDHGAISVLATPSVIGNTSGAFTYMRDYPYMCWEQRLSKGVMASHFQSLKRYLADELRWPQSQDLPARMLDDAARFQAPNGGMVYWVADNARVSPYLSAYTAIAFDWLRRAGSAPPAAVQDRLDGYLRGLLRHDRFPQHFSCAMASNVRAVALAALARRGTVDADEVLRYRAQLPRMSVFAKAHYLEAAYRTMAPHPLVKETLGALLAHGNQSAGKFALSAGDGADDGGRYLLETPARANCAALSSLAALAADAELGPQVLPLTRKLVRSVSAARGKRDHWQNTQENAFCMAALVDYARRFEAETPSLTLRASIADEPLGTIRFSSFKDAPVSVSRPLRQSDRGHPQVLSLQASGGGRGYYSARVSYAMPAVLREPVAAGMQLRREFSVQREGAWSLLESPMQVRRGELIRVDLYLSLPTARHFVVVDDPVPGALEPVNREFATSSAIDADATAFQPASNSWWHQRGQWREYNASHWSFYHQELRHDSARFYADYLPAGDYHLSYAAQVIATGEFSVQAALAQEMYDPDIHATGRAMTIHAGEPESPPAAGARPHRQ